MDFISWLLSLIGIGSDQAAHRSGQRMEAIRLNAEVAAEAGRVIDILSAATPNLTRRCADLCGEDSQIYSDMVQTLNSHKEMALQILEQTENIKKKTIEAGNFLNWHIVLAELHSWRANATRLAPWVQNIVDRYDSALREAEQIEVIET